jgi:type I restriction enzyme, S subunit
MRWLPPVPEHWNEQRAKTFFREVDERSPHRPGGAAVGIASNGRHAAQPEERDNVQGGELHWLQAVPSRRHRVNTLWAWMAALGASAHAGIVSPAYGIYRPIKAESFQSSLTSITCYAHAPTWPNTIGRSTGIRASRLRLYPNQFLDIPADPAAASRARPDRRLPARAGRPYRPLHQGQARLSSRC